MLLTGQASVLTGAPGPVLLYALLGLGAYPTRTSRAGTSCRGDIRDGSWVELLMAALTW